ncbi:hypothetical protein X757_02875 [Mesorhizobium sp. LSHC414A00]|nr:hypothetical protein X757_02875 [Mesorhizobium sp. LSHC414A00]
MIILLASIRPNVGRLNDRHHGATGNCTGSAITADQIAPEFCLTTPGANCRQNPVAPIRHSRLISISGATIVVDTVRQTALEKRLEQAARSRYSLHHHVSDAASVDFFDRHLIIGLHRGPP